MGRARVGVGVCAEERADDVLVAGEDGVLEGDGVDGERLPPHRPARKTLYFTYFRAAGPEDRDIVLGHDGVQPLRVGPDGVRDPLRRRLDDRLEAEAKRAERLHGRGVSAGRAWDERVDQETRNRVFIVCGQDLRNRRQN